MVVALDAGFDRGAVLVVDVDVRRGIVADEHGGQSHMAQLGNVARNLLADTGRERSAFH